MSKELKFPQARATEMSIWINGAIESLEVLKKIARVEKEDYEAAALGAAVLGVLDEPLSLLYRSKESLDEILSELRTEGTNEKA